MLRQLLLLLLPALTLAYIHINLKGVVNSDEVYSKVYAKGFQERVIEDQDRAFLGLESEDLKVVIGRINGKNPDEVYLTSTQPFGFLYARNGWKEVHVRIQPLNDGVFFDYKTETVRLSKTKYENPNSRPRDTFITENGNLIHAIYSYCKKPTKIKGVVTIMFTFDIDDYPADFVKTFPFGVNIQYKQNKYWESNVTLRLEPFQKVTAELEAANKTIKIEIPYVVSLSGDVIAKYNEMYKDKYFFKFNINDIIKNNTTTQHLIYQYLVYQVISDAHIHIRDSKDIIIRSIPAEDRVSLKGTKKAMNKDHDTGDDIPVTRKKMIFDLPDNLIEKPFDEDEESNETNDKPEANVQRK